VTKFLLVVVLAGLTHAGSARGGQVIEAIAQKQPVFEYASATVSNPIRVSVASTNGSCRFIVALVGLQNGIAHAGTLTGRIDRGHCKGRAVKKGIVAAYAEPSNGKVRLKKKLQVIILG
jgi:hypothetical protein